MKKGLVKEALFAFLILQSLLTGSGLNGVRGSPQSQYIFPGVILFSPPHEDRLRDKERERKTDRERQAGRHRQQMGMTF